MKKTNVLVLAFMSFAFASCASNSVTTVSSKTTTIETIDWKGAAIGEEIPSWVREAIDNDESVFLKMPQFDGKKIFFAEEKGKNLKVLKSWVDNFNAQSQFSKELSSYVQQKFGGELNGNLEDEEETYLHELVSSFSRNEINGFGKELDYWVQTRKIDKLDKSVEDSYQYIVVYAIDENLYKTQIKEAMENVPVKNAKQDELKQNVERSIFEVQVWAETQE